MCWQHLRELDALRGRDDLDRLNHSHCIGDGAVRGGAPLSSHPDSLNSVANSLREVAQGRLDARVPLDEQAIGETAQLVRDFNTMAERLQSMTREREFWNAAIAHELRTPVTILRGRLQGLAEGVFPPERALFEGLLRQVEGLTHLIEDLRVLSLNDSGHRAATRGDQAG